MKYLLQKVFKPALITIVLVFFSLLLYPQSDEKSLVLVKGTITDENNKSLQGVSVMEKGTNNVTITESSGQFSISVRDEKSVLIFSFVGFLTQEVPVSGRVEFNIRLQVDAQSLERVVVVGYGSQQKANLTGSVASISADKILKLPIQRADEALQGRAAGVMVRQNTFAPGEGNLSIVVRGRNSINGNNNPLFVIDGVLGGNINTVEPNDIQSIEILKDASAASIYGSQGANGVVIITTKSGRRGKPAISFDTWYGISQPSKKFDLMNAKEYMEYVNDVRAQTSSPVAFPDVNTVVGEIGDGTDWQDELFRNGHEQKYYLSAAGGSEDILYTASAGYLQNDGIVPNVNLQKFTSRFNVDIQATKRLKLLSAISYASTVTNSYAQTFGFDYGPLALPTAPPILKAVDAQGNLAPFLLNQYETGNPRRHVNGLYLLDREIRESLGNFLQLNFGVEYKLAEFLNYKLTVGLQSNLNESRFFSPKEAPDAQSQEQVTSANKNNSRFKDRLVENTLTFNKRFSNHSVTALVGTTFKKLLLETTGAGARNFVFDQFEFHNLSAGNAAERSVNSSFYEEQLLSYFSRLNYSYKDKYLLQINGRYDGSSKFAPGNKWAFFPAASIGWRLSEEEFIRNIKVFDNLKFRASYGSIGSHGISSYATLQLIGSEMVYGFNNTPVATYIPRGLGNKELKWETTTQFDAGLDMSFLNNKLNVTLDYYHKKTTDLLLNQRISIVNFPDRNHEPSITSNLGSLQNSGFEISINYNTNIGSKVKWSIDLNSTFQNNKILDLALPAGTKFLLMGDNLRRNYHKLEPGQAFGNYVGYQTDGLYQTQAEINASAQPFALPGDFKYVDQDGDGEITTADFVVLGNANPDIFGGITNTFSYRKFELSVFLFAMLGQEVFNYELSRYKYDLSSSEFNKFKDVATKRWTGPGTSNDIPRAGYKPINISDGSDGAIDRMVEDGSFLKLRNVTLTYNLSPSFLRKWGVGDARIFVQGQNLFTITKYSGYDPETNQMGNSSTLLPLNASYYPSTRSFMAGLNLRF